MAHGNVRRWLWIAACSVALVACGGGGGGGGGDGGEGGAGAGAAPEARGGTYTGVTANGQDFLLSLDFDRHDYMLTRDGGTFTDAGAELLLQPGGSSRGPLSSMARVRFATDAVIGAHVVSQALVPFVGARKFLEGAAAAGIYNLFARRVDFATGAVLATSVQQGEITADGRLRLCEDAAVVRIADCPAGSTITATLATSGPFFATATPALDQLSFVVAQVGADKVILGTQESPGAVRRSVVGLSSAGAFTPGSFAAVTSEPGWGAVTLGETSFSSTITSQDGVTRTISGTSSAAGNVTDVRLVRTENHGDLFAAVGSEIGIVLAAPGNTVAPGFFAIGTTR